MGNLDKRKNSKRKRGRGKRRRCASEDDEESSKGSAKRAKLDNEREDTSKRNMRIGDGSYTEMASVMIADSSKYLDSRQCLEMGELGNTAGDCEKSFQSITSLNVGNMPSMGSGSVLSGSLASENSGSMTVFFRARSTPMKYVKPTRPEIIGVDDFQLFMTKYRKYYVDKTLWIRDVLESKDRI
jgi:hypothetical protein